MKSIWYYLNSYKKETILAPVFKMLEALFELIIPLIVASIIDIGIRGNDSSYIISRGILMIVLGLIGTAISITGQFFAAKSSTGSCRIIRKDLFYHIGDLSYKDLDETGTSRLITTMTSDVNLTELGINRFLRLILRSPFIIAGATVMAMMINLKMSLIFWIVIGILVSMIYIIMRTVTPMNRRVQEQLEKATRSFRENLTGARVVRAFNRQNIEFEEFKETHNTLYRRQVKAGTITSLLNPFGAAVINFAIVILLWTGAINVDNGFLTQGQVVALINYMSQILIELIKLANMILMTSRAVAGFKRIQQIMGISPSLEGGDTDLPQGEPLDITLKNVSFAYNESGDNAIENISFHIPAGSRAGIIGGTGSGKSTLVNIIAGYYRQQSGDVCINGLPLDIYKTESILENISVAPQKAALFAGTLKDNLRLGNKNAADEECYDALRASCAIDFVEQKGSGLDLYVDQNGRNFSGGQKQRLTIARALLKKAGLLILDDSYSALDYATQARIKSTLAGRRDARTVITVSQRVSSIYDSDIIIVLDDGTLAGCGKHSDLYQNCPVYREICESQNFHLQEQV